MGANNHNIRGAPLQVDPTGAMAVAHQFTVARSVAAFDRCAIDIMFCLGRFIHLPRRCNGCEEILGESLSKKLQGTK